MHSLRASTVVKMEELLPVSKWMLEVKIKSAEELSRHIRHVIRTPIEPIN